MTSVGRIEVRRLTERALAIWCARSLLDASGETTIAEVAELLVPELSWPGLLVPYRRNDRAMKWAIRDLARWALAELEATGDWTSAVVERDGYVARVWSEVP